MRLDADHVAVDLMLPQPTLLRAVPWKPTDDPKVILELHEKSGAWIRRPAWRGDVLDGLVAGEGFRDLVRRYARRHPEERYTRWADSLVRSHLMELHKGGAVRLALPEAPTSFGDRYHVQRLLGRGGFGIAWLCEDSLAGGLVVVKEPWCYFHPMTEAVASLEIEANILRRVAHPSIAGLRGVLQEPAGMRLVREYVEGRDLAQRGVRPPEDVLAIGRDIARIVHHVHASGFLVLDLGPKNFMRREPDRRLMMIDLGLAEEMRGDATRLRGRTGMPGYVSPEVIATQSATVRSDVWSLGRLLFALGTGVAPTSKTKPADVDARLPPGPLRDAVLRLSADDPADRPQDMVVAARVLEEALGVAA